MSRLPILMYHGVSKNKNSRGLTIDVHQLESHFKYLKEKGYQSFHFSELESFKNGTKSLPKKSVIITFDDVYVNQLDLAYPLLKKYDLKACFYIPFAYVGASDNWNEGKEAVMTVSQLKQLNSEVVELGLHSFFHKNYKAISIKETVIDFKKCDEFISENKLNISNVLAYPFGKYPRKNPKKEQFLAVLKQQGVAYGLRIGNRINKFPFKDNYQVQRIDIKGEDNLSIFKLKLRFGKLRVF
jgi:peptidoglycan/xylan/chitin deacetylase (PgdA/CDA1 family)